MASHVLEIAENNRYLSIVHGNICIKEGEKTLGQIPLDMLACVMLTAQGIIVSKHFLACMGEANIPVLIMGKNYLPISIALPVSSHYKQLTIAEKQVKAGDIIKKQIWQKIIISKIQNQAQALEKCVIGKCVLPTNPDARKNIDKLKFLAQRVRSGDKDNKEGQAAQIYWQALFGKKFYRDQDEEGINAFLNYGYAIVRAVCARAICASGLLPQFGIHHHNQFNAFCLADDLMEPFRPFVDCLVFNYIKENELTILDTKAKRHLSTVLQSPLYLEKEESTLLPIALKMAQALYKSYSTKQVLLEFPQLKKK